MANSRKSRSPDLLSIVGPIAKRHLSPGDRVVLGLSGGLDSVVLLDILRTLAPSLGFSLSCLHVNHGISPNASDWAAFCSRLCEKWGISMNIAEVDISPHLASGIEAAARSARYAAFEALDADCILLAQHRDDQAETLLLQLFRGAGVKGLAAMAEAGRFKGKLLLRPLLQVPKKALEAHAHERELEWIVDESNADLRFDRNFVRHGLFPRIGERYPAFRETLCRASGHIAEASTLLDELAQIDASGAMGKGTLSVSRLGELSEARAKNLLRHFFSVNGVRMPSSRRLLEMLKQFSSAKGDSSVAIGHEGYEIRIYRGMIQIVDPLPPASGLCRAWQGEPRLFLPELDGVLLFEEGAGGIDPAKLVEPVTVRTRRGGERFRSHENRPEKSLKSLFQECGMPPWRRGRIPLLYCGEHLVWVPGVGLDPHYRGKTGFLPCWEPNSPQICDIP